MKNLLYNQTIQFQNALSVNGSTVLSYSFSAATYSASGPKKLRIDIALGNDYDYISAQGSGIFTDQLKTYLRIPESAAKDTSGNKVLAIDIENAIPLGPAIVSWALNMETGIILITTSEDVNTTFVPKGIKIQNNANSATESLSLSEKTSVITVAGSQSSFQLHLLKTDQNILKFKGLGNSASQTYLAVEEGLTRALSIATLIPRMETVAVNDFRALKVRDLVSDSAVPVCLSFILDLNKGFLYLEFDESIVASSLQVTGITLLSSTKGAAVTLSEASGYAAGRVSTANYTVAVVQLAKNDLDLAKLRHQEANLDIIVGEKE